MATSCDGISGLKCDDESHQDGAALAVPRGLGGQWPVCLTAVGGCFVPEPEAGARSWDLLLHCSFPSATISRLFYAAFSLSTAWLLLRNSRLNKAFQFGGTPFPKVEMS